MTPEFTKERDALRATNRQLAEANAALTARVAEFDAVCESLHQTRAEAAGLETDLKEARALNTQVAAQVDDARRQRDECVAKAEAARERCIEIQKYSDDDARCNAAADILEAMTSEPTPLEAAVTTHTATIAVTAERVADLDLIVLRCGIEEMGASTDEAVALITALLADGRVHSAWLHGRGGK